MEQIQQLLDFNERKCRKPRPARKSIGLYHVSLVRDKSLVLESDAHIQDPQAVVRLLASEFADADREKLICVWLNCRKGVIGMEIVSIGTVNASLAHPREIFKGAILQGAVGIVLAHNHPSGDPSPSEEDRRLTRRVNEAARILGIDLVDHIVIGQGRTYSFKGAGDL